MSISQVSAFSLSSKISCACPPPNSSGNIVPEILVDFIKALDKLFLHLVCEFLDHPFQILSSLLQILPLGC